MKIKKVQKEEKPKKNFKYLSYDGRLKDAPQYSWEEIIENIDAEKEITGHGYTDKLRIFIDDAGEIKIYIEECEDGDC